MAILQGWVGGWKRKRGMYLYRAMEKNGRLFSSLGAIEFLSGRRDGYKGREQLTRIDRGIFG